MKQSKWHLQYFYLNNSHGNLWTRWECLFNILKDQHMCQQKQSNTKADLFKWVSIMNIPDKTSNPSHSIMDIFLVNMVKCARNKMECQSDDTIFFFFFFLNYLHSSAMFMILKPMIRIRIKLKRLKVNLYIFVLENWQR